MKTVLDMNLSSAAAYIAEVADLNTLYFTGQPGIGKSTILKALAKQFPDYRTSYIDCANLDIGDIAMPVVFKDTMTTKYAPNDSFGVRQGDETPLIIMLDELDKCTSKAVLNMLLPLCLEHRLGSVHLPVGSMVFATGNLDTDGVSTITIPGHAMNRLSCATITNPTGVEWINNYAADNGIHEIIMQFAREHGGDPDAQEPAERDAFIMYRDVDISEKSNRNPYIYDPRIGQTRHFCTPRSLEKASNILHRHKGTPDELMAKLAGTVGETAARDIEALVHVTSKMPRLQEIVADPKRCFIPDMTDAPNAAFLLAFMLAARITPDNASAVLEYVSRWTNVESVMLFLTTICRSSKKLPFVAKERGFTLLASKYKVLIG